VPYRVIRTRCRNMRQRSSQSQSGMGVGLVSTLAYRRDEPLFSLKINIPLYTATLDYHYIIYATGL
jgi:hypothetical protein